MTATTNASCGRSDQCEVMCRHSTTLMIALMTYDEMYNITESWLLEHGLGSLEMETGFHSDISCFSLLFSVTFDPWKVQIASAQVFSSVGVSQVEVDVPHVPNEPSGHCELYGLFGELMGPYFCIRGTVVWFVPSSSFFSYPCTGLCNWGGMHNQRGIIYRHGGMSRIQYQVMAIPYSGHVTSLRSLATICIHNYTYTPQSPLLQQYSLKYNRSGYVAEHRRTCFWYNPHYEMLWNAEWCILPSLRSHSKHSYPSPWSYVGYSCTLHVSQMGSRDWLICVCQGNHDCHVPITLLKFRSAEGQCQWMFLSAGHEVAEVETLNLQCVQILWGRETSPKSLIE